MVDTFESKKQGQLQALHNNIVNGNSSIFKVFNHEAGLGKSRQAEKSMISAWKEQGKKSLYVYQFIDQTTNTGWVNEDEETIHGRINVLAGEEIAIAITEENKYKIKEYIDVPIIVITHERYKSLCASLEKRKLYIEGRHNLIIDEMPSMVEVFEESLDKMKQISELLPEEINNKYLECIDDIKKYLIANSGKSFFNSKKQYDTELDELKLLIQNKMAVEYFKDKFLNIYKYNTDTGKNDKSSLSITKNYLLQEVEIFRIMYRNTCCSDGDKIWVFDDRIQYFTLNNNLILDANGGFNYLYQLNPELFQIQKQSKIIDHSRWLINWYKINTNKSAKAKYIDFYDKINNIISLFKDDKTLLIGNIEDEKYFKDITKTHFGNFIGKNDWRKFDKIVIIHNPQIPFYVYALKYLYYSKNKLDNRSSWDFKRNGYSVVIDNCDIEKIRVSELTGHLYQAVKRINRDNDQWTEVYLFNADQQVIDKFIKEFKNINIKEHEIKVTRKERTYNNIPCKNESYPKKFIELLKDLKPGEYSKKWLINEIGFDDNSNFNKTILKHEEVSNYLQQNKFQLKSHSIVLFKI
jgi:hypothetical protein